jgi:hypothetical protein
MLSISIDLTELNSKFGAFGPELTKGIRVGLGMCARDLIIQARKELDEHFNISAHSRAPSSIQVDDTQTTDTGIVVGINDAACHHTKYLHEGTTEHFVEPNRAKALHWVQGGESRFSKGHTVSGIVRYQFLYEAANKLKAKFTEIVRNAVEYQLKRRGIV